MPRISCARAISPPGEGRINPTLERVARSIYGVTDRKGRTLAGASTQSDTARRPYVGAGEKCMQHFGNRPAIDRRRTPKLSLVYEKHPPLRRRSLPSAGKEGASDLDLLRRNGVTTVGQCAVNLDFNYVRQADLVSDHQGSALRTREIAYYRSA